MEQEALNTVLQPQFIFSMVISIIMATAFILWQRKEYKANIRGIGNLSRFFSKKENYSKYEGTSYDTETKESKSVVVLKDVSNNDAELKYLIKDINDYIKKSKGTVAFSIIQNKTERRISMLYEIATSKLSFPTHIGLMGTFAGVFVGLIMFLIGTFFSGGITDTTIQSLISGVLVSMITSCCGIWMLIKGHRAASNATNQIDKDKNEFYEWIQNELMPSVDVSMVEAIGQLHKTIDEFEPTFSGVIAQFKDAFKDVTGAFGDDFRLSVDIVKEAVEKMGDNIDKINENIDLQNDLLDTIRSRELVTGLDAFVGASRKFSEITSSLDQCEKARRLMLIAAQNSINLQKDFNDSLQIPKQVASEINTILNRITTFERNIEGLGVSIGQTQLVGNSLVDQIKENITAIRSKQKVAEKMADTANDKLEKYFEDQKKELSRIAQKYNEALDSYLTDYENMLKERKQELENRKKEFTQAIDEKFSLEDIRRDFSSLKKLHDIYSKIEQLVNNGVKSSKLKEELDVIKDELVALNEKESKGGRGGFTLIGGNTAQSDDNRRRIRELESVIDDLKNQLAAKKEASKKDPKQVSTNDVPKEAKISNDDTDVISKEQLEKWRKESEETKLLMEKLKSKDSKEQSKSSDTSKPSSVSDDGHQEKAEPESSKPNKSRWKFWQRNK